MLGVSIGVEPGRIDRHSWWTARWRGALLLVLAAAPSVASAQGANDRSSLKDYVRGREDLSPAERATWEKAVMNRFGGAALDEDTKENVQITVAKSILSAAIFMQADPKKAAGAAFEGYRGALGYVPPSLAVHYQILVLEGRPPRGSMETLTFEFPKYYNDELAPSIVAFWEQALAEGTIPEDFVNETKEALAETKRRMRPLLADKLRLLARLDDARKRASGADRAQIDKDVAELEAELQRAFRGVAKDPAALDSRRPARERLALVVRELGASATPEEKRRLEKLREDMKKLDDARERDEAAARKAEEEAKRAAEAARLAEEEAKKAAEAARRAEAEEKKARDEAARREAERRRREAEARAEAEARRRVEAERRRVDEERRAKEARERADAERRRAEAERRRLEEERKKLTPDGDTYAEEPDQGPVTVPKAKVEGKLKEVIATWLGTPYKWGGTEKKRGTDCSGFTRGVNRESFSLELPRVSRDQYRVGRTVDQAGLEPGDLIFFDTQDTGGINHVGVFVGEGRFAHASSSRGVVYDELRKAYYQKAYRGARRVL